MRKRLRVLATVVLVVAVVAAVQSNGGGSSARFRPVTAARSLPPVPKPYFVSPAKQDVESFELAGNARGDAVLLWTEYARFGHTRLWMRAKRAGGSFGRPRALSGVHMDGVEPHAAVGDDGTEVVTWRELDRGKTSQKVASRRAGGSFAIKTLSSSRTPASTIYLGDASQLAISRDGTALLVSVGFVGGASQVVARARSTNGRWSRPQVVTTGRRGVRYPTVAFDGTGTAILAWERGKREFPDNAAPPVKQEIRVAVRPPGGRFGKPRRVSNPQQDARDAALAANARGDAALLWNSTHGRNLPGSRVGMAVRRAGKGFGAPHLLTPPGEAWLTQGALGPEGSLVVVWSEDRKKGKRFWCGCPRLVAARGSVDSGVGPSNVLSSRAAEWPSLASDAAGDVFATWLLYSTRGSGINRVQGRFASADGSLGPVIQLSPPHDHADPKALLYPDRTAFAAWTRLRHGRSRIEAVHVRVRP